MKSNGFLQGVLSIILLAGVFYANYFIYSLQKQEAAINMRQDEMISFLERKTNSLDSNFRHLQNTSKALGQSVVYLDSCQATKTAKQDRAERRGRFVGGLLKGLIPGL